jgi:hypothetical protein
VILAITFALLQNRFDWTPHFPYEASRVTDESCNGRVIFFNVMLFECRIAPSRVSSPVLGQLGVEILAAHPWRNIYVTASIISAKFI